MLILNMWLLDNTIDLLIVTVFVNYNSKYSSGTVEKNVLKIWKVPIFSLLSL